jgi:stachydrine N-demethylase, reductase component
MEINAQINALEKDATWDDSEQLECVALVPEAPDTSTFSFRAPSGSLFKYRAGQFLTLELPVPGGPLYRTYTISSSPSRPVGLSVTVKAQPGSIGTRWMLENLHPGTKIKASGPAGAFHLPAKPDGKFLFISAGSGVTPTLSMTKYLYDRGLSPDITFVNCARRPSEIIARRELEHMAARSPGIKLNFVVEEDDPFQVWTGYRGQLNQIMLGLISQDYLERDVYCCGPDGFMQAVRDMLNALGFDMERYHQESFGAPVEVQTQDPGIDDVVPQDDTPAKITFAGAGISSDCTQTDTVLSVAKAAGLNIASGCNFGLCGTCKVRKLKGEVHMVHNGGIMDSEIEDGFILACCSNPIGEVEIQL